MDCHENEAPETIDNNKKNFSEFNKKLIKKKEFVHGDLCLLKHNDGKFLLVDFDWAGKAGETKIYPANTVMNLLKFSLVLLNVVTMSSKVCK